MAHNSATLAKPFGRKRGTFPVPPKRERPKRTGQLPLYFPLEAKVLRTPFRAKILQTIYDLAYQELGDKIESVDVFVDSDYYEEPERLALSLTIWADVDWEGWRRADDVISKAFFTQASSWTAEELADFRQMIDFAIFPVRV